jgi:hypothetical protein
VSRTGVRIAWSDPNDDPGTRRKGPSRSTGFGETVDWPVSPRRFGFRRKGGLSPLRPREVSGESVIAAAAPTFDRTTDELLSAWGGGHMTAATGGHAVNLLGRDDECETLDRLLSDVRGGTSRTLVLRGEAGVGKSALLEHLRSRAAGCRLLSANGVQSEMELAYSGLHQLCAPLLQQLDALPDPQRQALATIFGLGSGPPPDRFLIGLATLTLLAETAVFR